MRALIQLASLLVSATALSAQEPADTLQEQIQRLRAAEPWLEIPSVVAPTSGDRYVAAGDTVEGDVAAQGGILRVEGLVTGDAVVYDGDIVIAPGGHIAGDAVAVAGTVSLEGGTVGGEMRALRGSLVATPVTPAYSTRRAAGLVLGWLAVLLLIGIGVLVFAGGYLQNTVDTLEQKFSRAFWIGFAGQLAYFPALILMIVALAITVLGIVLIPFAAVALALATAGLMTLGFLAVAQITGASLWRRATGGSTNRDEKLRALVVGVALYLALWLVAALLTPWPLATAIARGLAFAASWAAVTAGFGAALISRAGTRAPDAIADDSGDAIAEEEISWQTPTPIGGVAAARRSAEVSSSSPRT